MEQQILLCVAQCELAIVAADVLREFYSVRANSETVGLATLIARAQPLRARIESWRQTLPLLSMPLSELREEHLDNGAALRFSHLTLETMIFRALLRPLSYDADTSSERCREPYSTIFETYYVCAKVAPDMVSSLTAKYFAKFWPHCKHGRSLGLVFADKFRRAI